MEKNKDILNSNNYIFNKIKPVILFIFDFECVLCGHKSLSNHVYHIDKNHQNNNPFNLVCVCKICHLVIHSNIKVNFPYLVGDQNKQLRKLYNLTYKSNK